MGLITEEIEINWHNFTKKWYESKGYIYSKDNKKFKVKVKDLPDGSNFKIECECDGCKKQLFMAYAQYKYSARDNDKIYCKSCASRLYGAENTRISRLKTGLSFEQWCKNNNRTDVLDRWDYELNKYKPDEIGYSSGIKCWVKCQCGLHKSELKNISNFTKGQDESINCRQCNSFGQWLINTYGSNAISLYWSNKNKFNPFEVSRCSNKKFWLICQVCKNEKLYSLSRFVYGGFSCNKCSDGISYPNKFAFNLLEQVGVDFITEYSPDWIKPKRYDFYFELDNNNKYILEMDGGWHKQDNLLSGKTKEESIIDDSYKDKMANLNSINVIRIESDISTMDYIKQNILKSELIKLFDLSSINWFECHKFACNSLVKIICDLYNSDVISTKLLAQKLKISQQTAIRYLKQGSQINLCKYNAKKSII